jgi:small-conductance mechanosensitive channel
MFLDNLIPVAYAQAAQTAKTAAASSLVTDKTGSAGVSDLLGFVLNNLDNWIGAIVIVIVAFILAKMTAKAVRNKIMDKKGDEAEESVIVLMERITKIVIIGIGIVVAAAINGFNFTAVIGALSLGIGFALKDVIATFISSIVLLSQNRIKIGDLIKFGDILGTIVSIDTRVTVLQSVDGSQVVIPNQEMLNSIIISFTTNPFRRIDILIGVDYNTDIPMVTSLIRGVIDKDPEIVPKPEPLVLFDGFGENTLNIKIYFWIESSKSKKKIRSNVAAKIRQAFNEVGVNTPCAIRVIKFDEDDRALLKTMDSLKKGIVPEKKPMPTKEQIMAAAEAAGRARPIPEILFEKGKTQVVPGAPIIMTGTPAPKMPEVKPQTQIKQQPEKPATPPPTHL